MLSICVEHFVDVQWKQAQAHLVDGDRIIDGEDISPLGGILRCLAIASVGTAQLDG
jgi:hypothetical protein